MRQQYLLLDKFDLSGQIELALNDPSCKITANKWKMKCLMNTSETGQGPNYVEVKI